MPDTIQQLLTDLAHDMARRRLVWGNSGNISARQQEQFCITTTGSVISDIRVDEFVLYPVLGIASNMEATPSKEVHMHQAVYQERPDINFVLHSSPFYSTLLASSNFVPESRLFVESMYYLYDIEFVDYLHPGSNELASAVRDRATRTNVIILKNHGVLVYDATRSEAIMRLETLEVASKMTLLSKAGGIKLDLVEPEIVEDFIFNSRYKRRLPRGAQAKHAQG